MAETNRTLTLLRHAKAARPAEGEDAQRPLADRGRVDAAEVGRWLRDHGTVDFAVCSPARRARETWQLAAAELAQRPSVRHDPRLYGESIDGLLSTIRELPTDTASVVLIAHNPDLEELATLLAGTVTELKTATLAVLVAEQQWHEAGTHWARLDDVATPRGR